MTSTITFSPGIKTLSLSFVALTAALVMQAQSASQNIRLTKGQKLESLTTSTVTMSQEMMGQQVEFNANTTVTTLTEVKDVTSDKFLLTNTIRRLVTNTTVMGQETKFDSDKKEDMDGQTGAELKNKIGAPQDISVNKQGKIVEVKDTTPAAGSANMVNAILGSATVKGTTFPLLAPFPAKAVKAGDTWTDSTGSSETMKMVNTYTLRQVSGGEATIDVTGQMAKTGVVEQQGMQIPMSLSGTTSGESVIDISTGTVKKNSTTMKITGTMELMGQSIPLSMNVTAQTTVNKIP